MQQGYVANFLGAVSSACQSASVAGELGVMLQQKRPPMSRLSPLALDAYAEFGCETCAGREE